MSSDIVKVTFNIDKDLKKQVKQIALDNDVTATELYVKWIKKGVQAETKQSKLI